MVIVIRKNATESEIEDVIKWVESVGYRAHPSRGVERTIIGVVGDDRSKAQLKSAEYLPGVEKIVPILKPYKLASREAKEENTIIRIDDVEIGGRTFIVMAGPCSVESEEQLMETAFVAKKGGAQILRGGAFKPRTSPYSFQGLEEEANRCAEYPELRPSEKGGAFAETGPFKTGNDDDDRRTPHVGGIHHLFR
jgi:3-deoxy-7-phosphoheptulonate synthase